MIQQSIRTVALCIATCLATAASADSWPQWRGPGGQGHAHAKGLPATWGESNNVAWKTPIPGRGHSSPVVAGDHIWLTTADDRKGSAAYTAERAKTNTGGQPLIISSAVKLRAICIHKQTGKLLHDITLFDLRDPQWVHRDNSYASPTPVLEDGKLYCHFGSLGTACLDTKSGEVVWRNSKLVVMHENGPGSTPVLYKDKLILHLDGSDDQYIAALDKTTGKVAWKTKRSGELHSNPQLRKAYATPLVVDIHGRPTLVSPAADWVYGYDPMSGKELWKLNYGALGFSNVPRPVTGHGMVYVVTCFMRSQLLAVRFEKTSAGVKPKIAWQFGRQVPRMASPLVVGNEIYIVSDTGTLTCLDARTGDVHYAERLGGKYSASPLYADGRVYLFSREGLTTVLKPGDDLDIIATNKLDGGFFASPAVIDGALILRTDKALYRINGSSKR